MQNECVMLACKREKDRKVSLILSSESQKYWVSYSGFFSKLASKRIERSEVHGTTRLLDRIGIPRLRST